MERTNLTATTINERQHRVLVAVAAPLDGSVLRPMEVASASTVLPTPAIGAKLPVA